MTTNISAEIHLYPVEDIYQNPWQTRQGEDADHVAALADDIRKRGLLQTPVGRVDPGDPEHVQLAFGHSRLAAWRIACPGQPMPMEVRSLTDLEMSDLAVAENAKRKDLSALEKARLLQRRIADFGLTQAAAGEPLGLGQAAVSNLLRLLLLPAEVLDLVASGRLAERHARLLINLHRLAPKNTTRVAIEAARADGKDEEDTPEAVIADEIEKLIGEKCYEINNAPFDQDWENVRQACRDCCYGRVKVGWRNMCTDEQCYAEKRTLRLRELAALAGAMLGLAVAQPNEDLHLICGHRENGAAAPLLEVYSWDEAERAKKLIKRPSLKPELRVRPAPEICGSLRHVTTDSWIELWGTAAAVEQVQAEAIKAGAPKSGGKAKAQDPSAAAEERREERAARRRAQHDVLWILEHTAGLAEVRRQLPLSGAALEWMMEMVKRECHVYAHESSEEFVQAENGLLKSIERSDDDELRRQWIALRLIAHEAIAMNGSGRDFGLVRKLVEQTTRKQLGIEKLPKGWDVPPVHHTAWNCWSCGEFLSNKRLTKRDQEEGWVKAKDGTVRCPTCAKKARELAIRQPKAKARR